MPTIAYGEWQTADTAPRDGTRVLVVIRATEQGPGEVDVARWARPPRGGEFCWIATDSDAAAPVIYAEPEVVFWMPLPSQAPQRRSAVLASGVPAPPDVKEAGGSGI